MNIDDVVRDVAPFAGAAVALLLVPAVLKWFETTLSVGSRRDRLVRSIQAEVDLYASLPEEVQRSVAGRALRVHTARRVRSYADPFRSERRWSTITRVSVVAGTLLGLTVFIGGSVFVIGQGSRSSLAVAVQWFLGTLGVLATGAIMRAVTLQQMSTPPPGVDPDGDDDPMAQPPSTT